MNKVYVNVYFCARPPCWAAVGWAHPFRIAKLALCGHSTHIRIDLPANPPATHPIDRISFFLSVSLSFHSLCLSFFSLFLFLFNIGKELFI